MTDQDMTDSEQLVQRFLDQELSSQERVQFIARLGRDEALRQRALDLERLVHDATRLPRPVVPDGFAARVLERIDHQPSLWRRLSNMIWTPRTLRWNFAGAVAAICLMSFAVGGALAGVRSWRTVVQISSANAPATSERSPVLVRLVFVQPGARSVHAAGDFNGWNPARTPLEPVANGGWMVTIPLEPGRYEYMFVVDGQWMSDPFATESTDDGFGSRNAVLDIRPSADSQS
jgi:hypothetical protein